jgi:hypothetical protein
VRKPAWRVPVAFLSKEAPDASVSQITSRQTVRWKTSVPAGSSPCLGPVPCRTGCRASPQPFPAAEMNQTRNQAIAGLVAGLFIVRGYSMLSLWSEVAPVLTTDARKRHWLTSPRSEVARKALGYARRESNPQPMVPKLVARMAGFDAFKWLPIRHLHRLCVFPTCATKERGTATSFVRYHSTHSSGFIETPLWLAVLH